MSYVTQTVMHESAGVVRSVVWHSQIHLGSQDYYMLEKKYEGKKEKHGKVSTAFDWCETAVTVTDFVEVLEMCGNTGNVCSFKDKTNHV